MKHPLTLTLLAASALGLAACGGDEPAAPPASTPAAEAAPAPSETAPAVEGEDHAHAAPHGGTVKTAGAGHLELVTEHTAFRLYVLDGAEKPLPVAGITGAEALVQVEGGDAVTVPLMPMGDHLHATLPAGTMAYTTVVTVPVAGEVRTAQFTVGLDSHTDHAH